MIGGGPSPNTGGFGGTIEDTDFLNGMYAAGAKGYMDALGVHNYGGNTEPERDPWRLRHLLPPGRAVPRS